MPKLVRLDDPAVEITHTAELVPAKQRVKAYVADAGTPTWQWTGDYEDSCESYTEEKDGQLVFLDEQGNEVLERNVAYLMDDGKLIPLMEPTNADD